jgi:two-component system CAI-1 autoinducer sensor kinase/phosphatase CqsS
MDCVQAAIARYVFTDAEQRTWVQLDAQTDFIVVANQLLVSHVVLNLLRNAIQAVKAARRHDAGSIRIWAEAGERGGVLHIADNGIGIDAETRTHIFRPFFTTRSGGTGLGLHFCRNVMQRCGGRIDFRSEAGRGTEFILQFPAPRYPMPAPSVEPADRADVQGANQPSLSLQHPAGPPAT